MGWTKKELEYKQEIEEEISIKEFPERLPIFSRRNLGKRQDLIDNCYIIKSEDGKKLILSGGYKIFLYIIALKEGRENVLKEIVKNKSFEQYRHFLIIEKREKEFGIKGRLDNIAKGFRKFECCKIIFDKRAGDL